MDKETLAKLNMELDLLSDVSSIIKLWMVEGEGNFTISDENFLTFQHDLGETISKYAITEKAFFNGVETLDNEYHKFFKMYNSKNDEYREYKMLAENKANELIKEKDFLFALLMEKCEELNQVKKKLSSYEN